MIILILFLYSFSGHTVNGARIDFKASKPVMCYYLGNKMYSDNPATPNVDPKIIPKNCEIIIYTDCDLGPPYSCNTDTLKALVGLKKPVLLRVFHEFADWLKVLTPDGNAEDAKIITDYATANGAAGVIVRGISPTQLTDNPNGTLSAYILPYLKQLKCQPDFIVGISLDPYSELLTDPCVFNYEASNDLLDFYILYTYDMNTNCFPSASNMDTPIHKIGNYYTLDDVVELIKLIKIAKNKIYFAVDLQVIDANSKEFLSNTEVCTTEKDTCNWCIPTTKNYYDKAEYIKKQNFGILVSWIEYDDSLNSCECGAFIGFQNIVAGYKGGKQIPCPKLDCKAALP